MMLQIQQNIFDYLLANYKTIMNYQQGINYLSFAYETGLNDRIASFDIPFVGLKFKALSSIKTSNTAL